MGNKYQRRLLACLGAGLTLSLFSGSGFVQDVDSKKPPVIQEKVMQESPRTDHKSNVEILYFGPFAGYNPNPAHSCGLHLKEQGYSTHFMQVRYQDCVDKLKKVYEEKNPKVIIGLGVAGLADKLCVSIVGVNHVTSDQDSLDQIIDPNYPSLKVLTPSDQFFFHRRFEESGIEYQRDISQSKFMCNAFLFNGICLTEKDPNTRLYFLHVPADVYTNKDKLKNLENAIEALARD